MTDMVSVKSGLKIAVTHPKHGAAILASAIASAIGSEKWITRDLKLKFCILFIENLIDGSIEKNISRKILTKVQDASFHDGIRLMKRYPEEGMKYLVALIMEELKIKQGFNEEAQVAFYEELLSSFFPELSMSDLLDNKA